VKFLSELSPRVLLEQHTEREIDRETDRKREVDGTMQNVLPLLVDRTSVFRLSPVHFLTDLPTSSTPIIHGFGSIMNQNGSQSPHLSADSR